MPPVQELDLILDQVRTLLAQGRVEEAATRISALRPADAVAPDGANVFKYLDSEDCASVVVAPRPIDPALVFALPISRPVAVGGLANDPLIANMLLPAMH